ncbi:MAG: hypothetical protein ABL904_03115 [Hyphomicrobiaceae bacterium]
MNSILRLALGTLTLLASLPPLSAAAQPVVSSSVQVAASTAPEDVIGLLIRGSFEVVDGQGKSLSTMRRVGPVVTLSEAAVIEALRLGNATANEIASLWELLADDDLASLATPPIVKALAAATHLPRVREVMWSELAELSRSRSRPAQGLLSVFEHHRVDILPRLPPIRETEGGGDEMAHLMTQTRVFGDDIWQGLSDMVLRNPGAVARKIERERERGRPVKWEFQAFEGMMRWKDAHLVAGAPQPPRTLPELDTAGETFITVFNALHSLDDWYRKQMLRGLGPLELYNAAVGGEQELYRLGTSGYRGFIHPMILEGIKAAGSFEAFITKATPSRFGDAAAARSQRGMVFVRIASSFGLLDSVLETMNDRVGFVSEAITALGDPRSFEGSSTIVLDVLTAQTKSQRSAEFKRALLDRLYGLYQSETDPARRSVYGSMLSAYQTVTGDRRDEGITRAFPLDGSLIHVPFDRLFVRQANSQLVHRMFMRMHDDIDGAVTYAGFRTMMRGLGASVQEQKTHTLFRIGARQRTIEIYVNRPSESGVRQGIADIGRLLGSRRVHTVIGRGHTGIISPLQSDTRRLLGDRIGEVATVIVGSCGSDASVREMIGTFGYVPIVTTKSTGRQVLNNAIVRAYVASLRELPPGAALSMSRVVANAMAPFLGPRAEEEVREDAALYRVNVATALAAQLFDTHVHPHARSVSAAAFAHQ